MFTSLKARLAVLTLFCAFISIVAVSLLLITERSQEMEQQLITDLHDKARIKQSQLTRQLEMVGRLATTLGSHPSSQVYFTDGTVDDNLVGLIQGIQDAYWGIIHHVLYIDLQGEITLSPNRTGTDPSDHVGMSVIQSPFFKKALSEMTVTDFFGFSERDHFHQILFQPVKGEGGTIGIIGVEVCIDHLNEVFQEGLSESGIHVSLVTLAGERVVTKMADRKPPLLTAALSTARESDYVGFTEEGLKGVPVYAVYHREQGWPWILCLEQDAAVIRDVIARSRNRSLITAAAVLLLAGFLGLWAAGRISKPVLGINQHIVHTVEEHDLTREVPVLSRDEIGRMATILGGFFQKMRNLIGETKVASHAISDTATRLSRGAVELQTVSGDMEKEYADASGISETIGQQAQSLVQQTSGAREMLGALNDATRQMGKDLNDVSVLADMSDQLVNRTEEAVEGLRGSIEQISRNTSLSSQVREEVLNKVKDALEIMAELDQSTKSVDEITRFLEKLADQTGLLALNATIEAEKAGAAGKSFGVVAMDVKQLANQSSESAEMINSQIRQMQKSALKVGAAIGQINDTVLRLHQIGSEVTEAMENQIDTTSTVSEIVTEESGHLARITKGVTRVADGVGTIMTQLESLIAFLGQVDESASTSSELVARVRDSVEKMGVSCHQLTAVATLVNESTSEMNQRFARLDNLVAPYKTDGESV